MPVLPTPGIRELGTVASWILSVLPRWITYGQASGVTTTTIHIVIVVVVITDADRMAPPEPPPTPPPFESRPERSSGPLSDRLVFLQPVSATSDPVIVEPSPQIQEPITPPDPPLPPGGGDEDRNSERRGGFEITQHEGVGGIGTIIGPTITLTRGGPPPPPPNPPGPSEPVRVDTPPTRIRFVPPNYPSEARNTGLEGSVVLNVVIDETGTVTEVSVVQSAPLFDDAAVVAVRQWRYVPSIRNGRPVPVTTSVTVNFELSQ